MARFRKPSGVRGFWPGRRSTFRRMTRNIRTPTGRMMRMTYTLPEKKFIDNTAAAASVDTGTFYLLNGLSLGTSVLTRIGQKIVVKSIHVKVAVNGAPFAQTPTLPPNRVRVLLIWDNQPNTQTPTLGDILEDSTAGVGILSSQFTGYISRFRILWDERIDLGNLVANNAASDIITGYREKFLKTNLLVSYSDTNNGDIQDIITGAIFLVFVGASATAANYSQHQYYARIRFVDN